MPILTPVEGRPMLVGRWAVRTAATDLPRQHTYSSHNFLSIIRIYTIRMAVHQWRYCSADIR